MNCDTYLSMLSTLPVEELAYADAREHAATCRDCDRVTRVVAERERNMLQAFGELYPPLPGEPVAARARVISRRRRIALYYRIGLSVVTAAGIFLVIANRRVTHSIPRVRETFRLQCLAPDQAIEMVRAYVGPSVNLLAPGNSPVYVIRVVASPEEMARVRSALDHYDNASASQCGLPLSVPTPTRPPEAR